MAKAIKVDVPEGLNVVVEGNPGDIFHRGRLLVPQMPGEDSTRVKSEPDKKEPHNKRLRQGKNDRNPIIPSTARLDFDGRKFASMGDLANLHRYHWQEPEQLKIVRPPTGSGNAMQMLLKATHKFSANKTRTEMIPKIDGDYAYRKDFWTENTIWLCRECKGNPYSATIMQFHGRPDRSKGEPFRSPPFALRVKQWGDKARLDAIVRWDTDAVTKDADDISEEEFNLGSCDYEKPLNFVLHTIFSPDDRGLTEVYLNGDRIMKYSGPNCFRDDAPPYIKHGFYSPKTWLRIGKNNNSQHAQELARTKQYLAIHTGIRRYVA